MSNWRDQLNFNIKYDEYPKKFEDNMWKYATIRNGH